MARRTGMVEYQTMQLNIPPTELQLTDNNNRFTNDRGLFILLSQPITRTNSDRKLESFSIPKYSVVRPCYVWQPVFKTLGSLTQPWISSGMPSTTPKHCHPAIGYGYCSTRENSLPNHMPKHSLCGRKI